MDLSNAGEQSEREEIGTSQAGAKSQISPWDQGVDVKSVRWRNAWIALPNSESCRLSSKHKQSKMFLGAGQVLYKLYFLFHHWNRMRRTACSLHLLPLWGLTQASFSRTVRPGPFTNTTFTAHKEKSLAATLPNEKLKLRCSTMHSGIIHILLLLNPHLPAVEALPFRFVTGLWLAQPPAQVTWNTARRTKHHLKHKRY